MAPRMGPRVASHVDSHVASRVASHMDSHMALESREAAEQKKQACQHGFAEPGSSRAKEIGAPTWLCRAGKQQSKRNRHANRPPGIPRGAPTRIPFIIPTRIRTRSTDRRTDRSQRGEAWGLQGRAGSRETQKFQGRSGFQAFRRPGNVEALREAPCAQ
eukprot:357498-Chlamydomonas_euryale.AAC.1